MAKTMAEVLAEHTAWATTNPDGVWLVTCVDCRSTLGTYDAIVPKEIDRSGGSYDYLDAALAAHQAAALSAAGYGLVADAKPPEVRYVDLTTGEKDVLDEVVAFNAMVHLEAMDDNHWWLMVTSGGQSVRVNLYTKRAKITAHADVEDAE